MRSGLEFTAQALRTNVESADELSTSFTAAYGATLRRHHNFLVKGVFAVAMKACPYRADFYAKLGGDAARVAAELRAWLGALERIVAVLHAFLGANGLK